MPFRPHYVSIEGARAISGGVAVVLDVLRAFTTAAWAFSLGAERVILTDTVEDALAIKALIPGALAMKDSKPLPGFELSNSPIELQSHDLAGRTIVQRTTHGTAGAVAAKRADSLYCAGFPTARATADAILRAGAQEACFVVTGEDGSAEEDLACAEYIAALIEAEAHSAGLHPATHVEERRATPFEGPPSPPAGRGLAGGVFQSGGVSPTPYTDRVAASNQARIHAERVAAGTPGVHALDVEAAMDADRFDFAMRAREELIAGFGPVLVLRAYNRSDDPPNRNPEP